MIPKMARAEADAVVPADVINPLEGLRVKRIVEPVAVKEDAKTVGQTVVVHGIPV